MVDLIDERLNDLLDVGEIDQPPGGRIDGTLANDAEAEAVPVQPSALSKQSSHRTLLLVS